MKKYIAFLILMWFSVGACVGQDTLNIKTSAQCGTCKATLERGMRSVKGVNGVELDIDTKVLELIYDPKKTNPEKLRKAVTRIGYDADSLLADPRAYKQLPDCCKKGGHDTH
ncbi:MAG: heavy-metal-associated domain-containing protein [Sphingobacteriales bacterium]|jgi:mercuric ion binding protein|nr:heavy-metal-associated domain-containing protein [Sphingobacteriales bacterium]